MSAVDTDEWSASPLGLFTPGERTPGIHSVGEWVGARACMDISEKKKISCPCQEQNTGPSSTYPTQARHFFPEQELPVPTSM